MLQIKIWFVNYWTRLNKLSKIKNKSTLVKDYEQLNRIRGNVVIISYNLYFNKVCYDRTFGSVVNTKCVLLFLLALLFENDFEGSTQEI